MLATSQATAQEVYGYSSVDYDTSTGYITASSTTELDYSSQEYYKAHVNSRLSDDNNNLLASASANDNYQSGYVTVTYGTYDSSSDEYQVIGTHVAVATLYDYSIGLQYWDYYNFRFLSDFGFDWFPSYLFFGPGPEVRTPVNNLNLGATHSYAHKDVVHVTISLKNSGTIVPAPENEDYDTERNAAGTDQLGPLPMGTGRALDKPDEAYTTAFMVISQVSPTSAYSANFRWTRLITRRSWYIQFDPIMNRWNVSQRSSRGTITPDDDTGTSDYNDPTPSSSGKIYMYDDSALVPTDFNGNSLAVGDYIREEKAFTYLVDYDNGSRWVRVARLNVGQIIIVKKQGTSGVVSNDWLGIENSVQTRRLDAVIKTNEVKSVVGGTATIVIPASANQ